MFDYREVIEKGLQIRLDFLARITWEVSYVAVSQRDNWAGEIDLKIITTLLEGCSEG
jgi:hypothetical protein